MDSSISYNDDENIDSHINTQCMELAYEATLQKADSIAKAEGTRRLRLQIWLLEDENDELHEQLALGDDRIEALEQDCEDLRTQLEQALEEASRHESALRVQTRELNIMKAELSSMSGVTMDTTKLLTEKLSLARELATLKPELDHLRSQGSYQQTIVSEKLALQRQVNTLEVELDTEKRASKRIVQKSSNNDRNTDLQRQLDDLQKEHAREKRELEKAQKEAEKELGASESRKTVLESKLDQMRTKLRTTKEQLKECQAELGQSRAAAIKVGGPSLREEQLASNPRKRGASEISTDLSIGTPDGIASRGKRPGAKRGRVDQTVLGEKSTFSITPFLNRTVNMAADDDRAQLMNGEGDADEGSGTPGASQKLIEQRWKAASQATTPDAAKAKSQKNVEKPLPSETSVLGEAKSDVHNKRIGPKKSRAIGTLEKVAEEEADENGIAAAGYSMGPVIQAQALKPSKMLVKSAEESEPKKKKRKLLGAGKTLFDEEDGEATKRPAKVALGPSKTLGKGGLAGPKGGLKGGLSSSNTFGAFSPLKKDRRGIRASFLA